MNFANFRITFATIALSLATYIFIFHRALLSVHIKNKIRKTNHRVPSGIALIPAILAALAWQVNKPQPGGTV
jgi:hypothetical protein